MLKLQAFSLHQNDLSGRYYIFSLGGLGWAASCEGLTHPSPPEASVTELMRHKLRAAEGHPVYKLRKVGVELGFGQLNEQREFRRFTLDGPAKVWVEWKMM